MANVNAKMREANSLMLLVVVGGQMQGCHTSIGTKHQLAAGRAFAFVP
jgi:hypothetical protein